MTWRVLKFGGASVSRPELLANVARIVRRASRRERVVVVVSALAGVTDWLVAFGVRARERGDVDLLALDELLSRHRELLAQVASAGERERAERELRALGLGLEIALAEVAALGDAGANARDRCVAFGERLCAPIVRAALATAGIASESVDARELVVTDESFGAAVVDLDATRRAIARRLSRIEARAIVTEGFIGASTRGATTTLGRGGSDYSAALLGSVLGASRVELWKDVDGLASADPHLVSDALRWRRVGARFATRLSESGAKVLHRKTVAPLAAASIPLCIGNTARPDALATRVGAAPDRTTFGLALRRSQTSGGPSAELDAIELVVEPLDATLVAAFERAARALGPAVVLGSLARTSDGARVLARSSVAELALRGLHRACRRAWSRSFARATIGVDSGELANVGAPSLGAGGRTRRREARPSRSPKCEDASF